MTTEETAPERQQLLQASDAEAHHDTDTARLPTFTIRATIVGLAVGVIVCLSNVYFGLQNGHNDFLSMPSALLGFALFRPWNGELAVPFGPAENAIVSTVAGAVGGVPITAGLISAIAALEYLLTPDEGGPLYFTSASLIPWALGLCFFGMFFAMLFRKQFLMREDMPWPSATATAVVIDSLHASTKSQGINIDHDERYGDVQASIFSENSARAVMPNHAGRNMLVAFLVSGCITIVASFFPVLHNIPFLGDHLGSRWLWTFNFSPGIFGQGMITGPVITLHMLAGAFVGWGVLSPIAKHYNWAPGDVADWETGSRGWILWISLVVLLTDCLVNLVWMALRSSLIRPAQKGRRIQSDASGSEQYNSGVGSQRQEHSPGITGAMTSKHIPWLSQKEGSFRLPTTFALVNSVVAATVLCAVAVTFTFSGKVSFGEIVLAVLLALFLSLASIRAVGTADSGPVSGLAKLSQFIFALVVSRSNPDQFIINIAVGAIAEAGAVQAATIMFDLKVGQQLAANPTAQMFGHMIGALFGSLVSGALYKLYTKAYKIPGDFFQIPTAHMWISAARLAYGGSLPTRCGEFALAFALVFAFMAALKIRYFGSNWSHFLPGGVAFAIGIYNAPAFTLPRVLGSIAFWFGRDRFGLDTLSMHLVASALIVGESLFSLTALAIPR